MLKNKLSKHLQLNLQAMSVNEYVYTRYGSIKRKVYFVDLRDMMGKARKKHGMGVKRGYPKKNTSNLISILKDKKSRVV